MSSPDPFALHATEAQRVALRATAEGVVWEVWAYWPDPRTLPGWVLLTTSTLSWAHVPTLTAWLVEAESYYGDGWAAWDAERTHEEKAP